MRVFETSFKCVEPIVETLGEAIPPIPPSPKKTRKSQLKPKIFSKIVIPMHRTRNTKLINMKMDKKMELFAKLCNKLLPTNKSISYALHNDIYGRSCTTYIGKDECNTMIYMNKTNAKNMHLWIA